MFFANFEQEKIKKQKAENEIRKHLYNLHNVVMKSINAIQDKLGQLPNIDLMILVLQTFENELKKNLEAPGIAYDYRVALLNIFRSQIDTLYNIKTKAPQIRNSYLSSEEKIKEMAKIMKPLKDSYIEFNKVCKKYNLQEINTSSGRF